jgi:transcriptional antiterminator NusG
MITEPENPEQEIEEPHAEPQHAEVAVADNGVGHEPPPAPPESGEEEKPVPPPPDDGKRWYVVKVQSGREESIKDAIERRVKIEGLQEFFGEILIPVEKVTEMTKANKRVIKERKLYPGYLMVRLEFNDRMLYLFRETSGVGDFVGGGINKIPPPMPQHEVDKLLDRDKAIKEGPVKSKFDKGDRVKVKDGTFAGMEGEVKEVMEAKGALKVELTIFGRPVPVELEYWQVDYP